MCSGIERFLSVRAPETTASATPRETQGMHFRDRRKPMPCAGKFSATHRTFDYDRGIVFASFFVVEDANRKQGRSAVNPYEGNTSHDTFDSLLVVSLGDIERIRFCGRRNTPLLSGGEFPSGAWPLIAAVRSSFFPSPEKRTELLKIPEFAEVDVAIATRVLVEILLVVLFRRIKVFQRQALHDNLST